MPHPSLAHFVSHKSLRTAALLCCAALPSHAEPGPVAPIFTDIPSFTEDFATDWESSQTEWLIASWSQNHTQMSSERCHTDGEGHLVQTILSEKPARGGSLESKYEFGYGRWIARVKPTSVPGALNSIFTKDWDDRTTPKPGDGDKSEVDIEFLSHTFGPNKGEVHLAIHLRINDRDVSHQWDIPLDFNPSDDFHDWGFDILPEGVVWHVDGREFYRWQASETEYINPAYEFFMNSWTMKNWIKGPPTQDAHYLIDRVAFYPLVNVPVAPLTPATLKVRSGHQVLPVDPPDFKTFAAISKAGMRLPDAPKDRPADNWRGALALTPRYDPTKTHILGSLFRSFNPDTLRVTSADEAIVYQRGIDYAFNEDLALIANIDGRMPGAIKASAEAALQRLDLVQRDRRGLLTIKRGTSAWVCPALPEPDQDHVAIAGIYIAPWVSAQSPFATDDMLTPKGHAVTEHEICAIAPLPPVAPVNPERLSSVVEKLRSGAAVKIAFMGDSITLGAESTRWWDDQYNADSKTWKGRVIHALRQRFSNATIEVYEAYKGGTTIDYGLTRLDEVLAQKPDLIIASFGVNDSSRHVGKRPPESYAEAVATITDRAKAAGADVLWVTPFPIIPWVNGDQASRLAELFIPAMRATATSHGAALADVNSEFINLNSHGIPWWSQNHNWHNHPGDFGHKIYAETVLRCFAN